MNLKEEENGTKWNQEKNKALTSRGSEVVRCETNYIIS
jgi:hypothetical protein